MNDLMLHRAAQLLEAEFGPQWRTVADMLGTVLLIMERKDCENVWERN